MTSPESEYAVIFIATLARFVNAAPLTERSILKPFSLPELSFHNNFTAEADVAAAVRLVGAAGAGGGGAAVGVGVGVVVGVGVGVDVGVVVGVGVGVGDPLWLPPWLSWPLLLVGVGLGVGNGVGVGVGDGNGTGVGVGVGEGPDVVVN